MNYINLAIAINVKNLTKFKKFLKTNNELLYKKKQEYDILQRQIKTEQQMASKMMHSRNIQPQSRVRLRTSEEERNRQRLFIKSKESSLSNVDQLLITSYKEHLRELKLKIFEKKLNTRLQKLVHQIDNMDSYLSNTQFKDTIHKLMKCDNGITINKKELTF